MSTSEQTSASKLAIDQFNRIIEAIENRCMAVDGPVTPTLSEMREDELALIWELLQEIRRIERPSPQQQPDELSKAQARIRELEAAIKEIADTPYLKSAYYSVYEKAQSIAYPKP